LRCSLPQIFIAALTTLLCYLTIIYTVDNNNIGGIIAPVFLCFVLAFWVASMFLEIFGMGIETILYCFIADEEMFAVSERFAEKELVGTVASAQLEHKYWKAKKANKYNKVGALCLLLLSWCALRSMRSLGVGDLS
jgi:hypothetical protein